MSDNKKTFRANDESLNGSGFWVLTDGIDLSLYKKNPVILWMHERYERLPIGKSENIRVEKGELLVDPMLDAKDDFAMQIQNKIDAGIINMMSIGIEIVEYSEDSKYLKKGQRMPTVTKSILKEISFVDIGRNYNAVRLYDAQGNEVKLADGLPILELVDENSQENHKNINEMKSIALLVGLAESATEAEVLAKVTLILADKKTSDDALKVLQDAMKAEAKDKAVALVDGAITAGKITADKKDSFVIMAEANYDNVKLVLDSIQKVMKPSGIPQVGAGAGATEKKFEDLQKEGADAVEKFKAEDPEGYRKMYEDHYKVKLKLV